jgi:tetratricopeptide (TPR) repeat protein
MKYVLISLLVLVTCSVPPAHLYAEDEIDQPVELTKDSSVGHSLQQIRETISRQESEKGAYNPALRQSLLELGLLHREQGEYKDAVEAFEKALRISKANKGLHELSQLEIVELLIDTYSQLQDWQNLDKNLNYLVWLYRRNYSDDERLLPVIERLGQWYMQAYQLHSIGEAVSYLVKADDLYDEAVDAISRQYGDNAPQLIGVLASSAIVNYQIANDVNDPFKMSHRDIRKAMIPNKRPNPYLNEIAVREFYFDQSFHKGKRSLKHIINIHKINLPGSIVRYAQAQVYLGDYYLSLDRKWNAMSSYKKAYATLLEHDVESEHIEKIFGQPRRVEPFNIPEGIADAINKENYVDAVFAVPGNGWPKDIRIVSTHPHDNSELIALGKIAIAATRYRPRFEDGQPVATDSVLLRYYFRK